MVPWRSPSRECRPASIERINEELGWELASNKLTINFTDSPAPKYWKSSQRIVSVPDLEKATLTASILSTTVPDTGNNQTAEHLRMNRSGLRISTLLIRYSGREMILRRSAMKEDTDERGLHRYTVRLDTIHER
jgi:hypothetical protein